MYRSPGGPPYGLCWPFPARRSFFPEIIPFGIFIVTFSLRPLCCNLTVLLVPVATSCIVRCNSYSRSDPLIWACWCLGHVPKGESFSKAKRIPPRLPVEKLVPPMPNSLRISEKSNPLNMSSCEYRCLNPVEPNVSYWLRFFLSLRTA